MKYGKTLIFCYLLVVTMFIGCDYSDDPSGDGSSLENDLSNATTITIGSNDNPTIIKKAPAIGSPFVAGTFISLSNQGYEQHEFFYGGTAYSFTNTRPLTSDGKWEVAPEESASYQTRMIVYRPKDSSKFNGTVVVEWFNCTSGIDTAAEWMTIHTEIIRRGYAWIGISAQKIGVEGGTPRLKTPIGMAIPLKLVNYLRYCTLKHPGDSFSYDIFAQGLRLIKYHGDIDPLGGLKLKRMIVAGESQSAYRLVTFINAFGKSLDFVDGYFIHSRLGLFPNVPHEGSSGPLSESPQTDIPAPDVVFVRDDLGIPVMNLQTETDLFVLGSYKSTRQEDSAYFRLWEVAGAAHADEYITNSSMLDKGNSISVARVKLTKQSNLMMPLCSFYINSAPQHHFAANAALNALNNWVSQSILPPSAPRLEVNAAEDGFVVDEFGNVLGGVRSPYVDVPIARFSGENSSPDTDISFAFLMGQTDMLDDASLKSLYPSLGAYVTRVTKSAQSLVMQGFLMQEDADLIIGAAAASDIPPR